MPYAKAAAAAIRAHPWAAAYLGASSASAGRPAPIAGGYVDSDDEGSGPGPLSAAWAALHADMHGSDGVLARGEDLLVRLRGTDGAGTASVPTSGTVATEAQKGMPRSWCDLFGLQKTSSYSIAAYGYAVCMAFAEAWKATMQHLFDQWVVDGGTRFRYTAAQLDSYVPSARFVSIVAACVPGSPEGVRGALLTAIRPTTPRERRPRLAETSRPVAPCGRRAV